MNANDDQSLSILSGIVFLEEELKKQNVSEDIVAAAFDIKQQLLQYSHAMNDQLRVARTEYASLHAAVIDNASIAGLQEAETVDPETALTQMSAAVVTMRSTIRRLIKRTSIYCALAAFVGGVVAWIALFMF